MNRTAKICTCLSILSLLTCTHTTTIKFVDQRLVEKIPNYPDLPSYYHLNIIDLWNKNNKQGFYMIVFTTDLDLDKVIKEGGMHILYYQLRICGKSKVFFSGPVFPVLTNDLATVPYQTDPNVHYYVAYLPVDYQDEDERYTVRYHPDVSQEIQQYGVCFEIGAGAMGGAKLESNSLEIDF